jgi:hypothetical protein
MDRVEWPIILEILALITALFFVPCTILGTISPIVVKLAMHDLAQAGRTVGQIYAFGSVGSIVGTFLTGFWLIAKFGTYTVVWAAGSPSCCFSWDCSSSWAGAGGPPRGDAR